MGKPTVAIIGKPNVGKSTFFNYIVGSRISIVEDTPGVTRDRVYAETNWRGRNFTVVDTAGIEPESEDIIISQMREQAKYCNRYSRCNNIFNRCKTRSNSCRSRNSFDAKKI